MVFIYEPLPPGPHIRVIQVRTGLFSSEPICTFKVVNLNHGGLEKYMAVSYTWDKPGTSISTIRFADGQCLPLGQNLTDLFSAIRHRRWSSFDIWIDALCINQADPQERAGQVGLMDMIYSSAEQVIVWLGAGTPDMLAAFNFMKSTERLDWPDDRWDDVVKNNPTKLKLLLHMLAHPWFRRTWVIQEVTLSNNVWLLCGDDSVGFDVFSQCVFAVWKYFENWDTYDDDDPAHMGLWSVTRLIEIRYKFLESRTPVRWEVLLQAAFRCEATDHRDSVFAFRGIADCKLPVPEPDYTIPVGQEPEYSKSVESVYRDTAAALLCHGLSLDLLALGGIERERSPTLPTWVPDLRHFSFTEPYVVCDAAKWDAGGPLEVQPRLLSPDQLMLQVRIVDAVTTSCSEFDFSSVSELQATMKQVLALREAQQTVTPHHSWRRDLAMDLIFGLDINELPAGPEYIKHFDEWLQRLQHSTPQADMADIAHNPFHRVLGMRVGGWKAFGTQQGFFCIGPAEVERGDVLCVVPGCRVPLVLRPTTDTAGSQLPLGFLIVSWVYVSGLMLRNMSSPLAETLDVVVS